MHVVSLAKYKNKELIAVLKDMVRLAEAGQAHGLAFVLKVGHRKHWSGLSGDYARNPDEALKAVVRLKEEVLDDEAEDREESGT